MMATEKEINEWNDYAKRQQELFHYGCENGLIYPIEIDDDFMERVRNVYWGGMPLVVVLLCERICNGFCYDRSLFMSFGFGDDDFQMVYATIDGIRLRTDYIDEYRECSEEEKKKHKEHCYIERVRDNGSVWVYEPSFGLVYQKELYEQMEHPVVNRVKTKEEIVNSYEYLDILSEDIETSKYASIVHVPFYEACLKARQPFHMDALREELERYKKEIHYDELCVEECSNMKRMGLKVSW